MRRLPFLLLAISFSACAPSDPPPDAGGEIGPPTTIVVVTVEDGSQCEIRQVVSTLQLAGRYQLGGITGYSPVLVLNPDATFECTWHGCLGVYGRATGNWSIGDDCVRFTTTQAEGAYLDKPLTQIRLASFRGQYLLVEPSRFDSFTRSGPSNMHCLHKEEAGSMIQAAWSKWIEKGAIPRIEREANAKQLEE